MNSIKESGPQDLKRSQEPYADKYICILFCAVISFRFFCDSLLNIVRTVVPNTFGLDTVLMYAILCYCVLRALSLLIRRMLATDILPVLLLMFLVLISALRWGYHEVYSEVLGIVVKKCLPAFFVGIAVRDYDRLNRYLYVTAYVLIAVSVLDILLLGQSFFGITDVSSSMGFAYSILPATLVLCNCIMNKTKWYDCVAFAVSIALLLFSGSRGPLLCLLCAVGLNAFFAFMDKRKKMRFFILTLIFLVAGIIVIVYSGTILDLLISMGNRFGLSTRSLNALKYNTIVAMSTYRTDKAKLALEFASKQPLFGWGIIYDRILLRPYNGVNDRIIGCYPHNFFAEVLMQYGYVFGGIALAAFAVIQLRSIKASMKYNATDIFILVFCAGFIRLFVSGSYVDSSMFYLLIGTCIGLRRKSTVMNSGSQTRYERMCLVRDGIHLCMF